jgi:hypothetical protein
MQTLTLRIVVKYYILPSLIIEDSPNFNQYLKVFITISNIV